MSNYLLRFCSVLALFAGALALPLPVRAEDKHGAVKYKYTVHHGDQHAEKTADPTNKEEFDELVHALERGHVDQLKQHRPFNPVDMVRVDLGIWTLVIFIVLLFILWRFAWGPMLEGLQKRENTIRAAVEEAKDARRETERVRVEFKAEMDKAFAEIPKMMEEARRDAQHLAEEMRTKALAEIQADRQRLRREIETARDQALQELWNRAADLATLISAKAIRRTLSEEDHRRLVDDALAELRERGRTA